MRIFKIGIEFRTSFEIYWRQPHDRGKHYTSFRASSTDADRANEIQNNTQKRLKIVN